MLDGAHSERESSRSVQVASGADVRHRHDRLPSALPPEFPPAASKYGVPFARGAFATVRLEVVREEGPSRSSTTVVVKSYPRLVAPIGTGRQVMHELHIANECRLVGVLSHPHILAPHRVIHTASRTELYMEHATHGDLEAHVTSRYALRAVPHEKASAWMAGLLEALSYLHARRIAHRDVKLENIVLDANLTARLIDFGAAEDVSPIGGDPRAPPRRVSVLQGTPGYMPPEALSVAAARTGSYDALAADMWSAGVALYCLFNGAQLPFKGKDIHELRVRIVQSEAPPARFMDSATCRDLCRRLMSKEPGRRPTAEDARRHSWLASGHRPVPPSAATERRRPPPPVPVPAPAALHALGGGRHPPPTAPHAAHAGMPPRPWDVRCPPPAPRQAWAEDAAAPAGSARGEPSVESLPAPPAAMSAAATAVPLTAAGRPTGLPPQGMHAPPAQSSPRQQPPTVQQTGSAEALRGSIWRPRTADAAPAEAPAEALPPAVAAARELARAARPTVAELLIRNPQGWRELEPLAIMMRDARDPPRRARAVMR